MPSLLFLNESCYPLPLSPPPRPSPHSHFQSKMYARNMSEMLALGMEGDGLEMRETNQTLSRVFQNSCRHRLASESTGLQQAGAWSLRKPHSPS